MRAEVQAIPARTRLNHHREETQSQLNIPSTPFPKRYFGRDQATPSIESKTLHTLHKLNSKRVLSPDWK